MLHHGVLLRIESQGQNLLGAARPRPDGQPGLLEFGKNALFQGEFKVFSTEGTQTSVDPVPAQKNRPIRIAKGSRVEDRHHGLSGSFFENEKKLRILRK